MRPTKDFDVLYKAATGKISKLRLLAQKSSSRPTNEFSNSNQEISFAVIELHTAYSNFARSYFLSCTLKPTTRSGGKVTCSPAITNFIDAIDASMKACKNRTWVTARGNKSWAQRDEPSWHQPNVLIDSCQEIGCSNQTNIMSAFSIPTSAFENLTKFRNFFAHRNKNTMQKALDVANQYSISTTPQNSTMPYHPAKILCSPALGRNQTLLLDWIDDISLVIDILCQ